MPWGPAAVTRRAIAHWLVLGAAALTTLVAATVAAALAVFAGQALPQVMHYDLGKAQGTSLTLTALVNGPSEAAAEGAALRSRIAKAMPGIPFGYDAALWSDPLGLVPGALPASPSAAGRGDTPLVQSTALNAVASHATLVAGQWPTAPTGRQPIPAALPATAAALLHVSVGDVLRLRDRISGTTVVFDLTGTFDPRAADPYWKLSYIPAAGVAPGSGSATYGPLVVSQAAFGPTLPALSGSWVAQPDLTAFTEGDLGPASANVAALAQALPNAASLHGAQLVTGLSAVLAGVAGNVTVARSTLAISALELLALAVAALLAVSRLLAEQREAETALFTARGATWAQLGRLAATEAIPLAALAAVAGGLAGVRLAAVLAAAGPLGAAGVRLTGAPGTLPDALGAAAVVAVIAAVSLQIPVFASNPTDARASRGRQGRVAAVARAGVDVALLVLAVLAGWQLRYYSAASPNGISGIDPVLALAPALTIAAGSVATLRLLPLAARGADRLAAQARRLTIPLAAWQFSRMPVRQGSAALLLTMAAATGTLALAQHASWARSVSDQAAFANGGAVQVVPPAPLQPGTAGTVATARGVTHAMAVAAVPWANPGEVIGLDAAQAAQVAQVRGDQSPLPLPRLFRAITPSGGPPGAALTAPAAGARPDTISITVTLSSPAGPAALGPVPVTLTVMDRTGAAYQVAAGSLAADGRPHPLTAPLGGGQALYPLRVIAVTASFLMPLTPSAAPAVFTVSGLPLAGWKENLSSDLPNLSPELGQLLQPPVAGPVSGTAQGATFRFTEGNTIASALADEQLVLLPPAAQAPVPVIATKAFMDGNNLAVGDSTTITMNGPQVPVRIVAEVPSFPTVTAAGGAVIADLGSLQESLARQFIPPQPVSEWWLATDGGDVPRALPAGLPAGTTVTSVTQRRAAAAADSLSAAPQLTLLAMAAAATLLAVTGFWVSIAADVRRRRGETALLAALGVTQRGAAAALCVEKLLVGLPAAALGFLFGALLTRLLVPAVTLSAAAQQPVPPPLIVYDLPQAVPLALTVAALPALAAALAALQRPDPAAALRAAEAG